MPSFLIRKTTQLVFAFFVLVVISALPHLIVQMRPDFPKYFNAVQQQLSLLTSSHPLTYYNATAGENRLLLPDLQPFIQETLVIFSSALLCSSIAALLYAFLFYRAGAKIRSVLTQTARLLEMIPDLFWIIFSQFIIVILFKTTGFDQIEIAGGFSDSIRFLPILTLSLTTVFFFIKWLTGRIQEEQHASYLELARAKGIHSSRLFWQHLMPNLFYRFYLFFRTNIITILSSLVVIEYTFNVQGLFRFILINQDFSILLVLLLLIYLPFFILDTVAELCIPRSWKGEIS
ncbi:ABC transporter permease subunit [Exiguobacterium sp. Helios]|uniref:ABC transporter permease subunit n=1 Tax=unclassified Exiguobacterium TaxID=2644629 RepID=UPI00165DEA96|nr:MULTISPECIES: ABC transporter permease subunit [unclassified Exiguobacterium]QNR20582.1 ABC transporter permease subunit [Exiguobacterium sp. Helios]